MTLLGQHEYVEYSPLFIAMDPRAHPNNYAGYVYPHHDPRTSDPTTSWGMYSPTDAYSRIPVAQGKEHLQSATSALMSLQSEPSHTLEQYSHVRPGERPSSGRTSSDRQTREQWAAPPGQATSPTLRFHSPSHPDASFRNPSGYLQGAHRWASSSSSPSTPTPGSATDGSQPTSYLNTSGPPNSTSSFPPLVTHAPQPLHAQSSTSSELLGLHTLPFTPSTADRPRPNVGSRRRSSASASGSNTVTASSHGLHLADPTKSYHSQENINLKLARSPSSLNLSGEGSREKPKLLTKDQKKRNHIFSEQKRRATIRHGYALLCEEVPSLRLAIAAAEADEADHSVDGEGRRRRRSRGRVSGAEGERLDGRAGPRSESVVLVKTIDHLKDLLATRQELIARVQELRAGDDGGESPWERTWDGGTGLAPEGIEDDGEEDGEGESDEADGQ